MKQLATEFANEFFQHIDHYANFTHDQIHETVGECRPLYDTFNATVSTFCVKIGYPLAGFWFSLTCLILLFVPLIMVGSVLARLYKKYKGGVYERFVLLLVLEKGIAKNLLLLTFLGLRLTRRCCKYKISTTVFYVLV